MGSTRAVAALQAARDLMESFPGAALGPATRGLALPPATEV